MKTRILHTNFWKDYYISSLSKTEKLLFVYLLTNERVNICGIYELPDKYISAELDIPLRELQQIKNKLQKDNRFLFYKGWIKIPRVEKYNSFLGIKNMKAKEKELALVPSEVIQYRYTIDTSIDTSIDTPINHNHNINHNKKLIISNNNIDSITEVDITRIAEDYKVPSAFVRSKVDDIKNYCASTGKVYKDYIATLRNWVKKDAIQIRKETYGQSKVGHIE